MQEETTIQIIFTPEETEFYRIIVKHCNASGLSISDYIKDIIKKDLAWGHFAKRKRKLKRDKKERPRTFRRT